MNNEFGYQVDKKKKPRAVPWEKIGRVRTKIKKWSIIIKLSVHTSTICNACYSFKKRLHSSDFYS